MATNQFGFSVEVDTQPHPTEREGTTLTTWRVKLAGSDGYCCSVEKHQGQFVVWENHEKRENGRLERDLPSAVKRAIYLAMIRAGISVPDGLF